MAPSLQSILLAQPQARFFGTHRPFSLPYHGAWTSRLRELPPSRTLQENELLKEWVSPVWRAADVPLPFHSNTETIASRGLMNAMELLNEEAPVLQYLFSDGLCLTAAELLRHPLGRSVPRPLLPLALQIRPETETVSLAHRSNSMRPQWLIQMDQTVSSLLMAVERINKSLFEEAETGISILYTLSPNRSIPRQALQLSGIGIEKESVDRPPQQVTWTARSTEPVPAEPGTPIRGSVCLESSGADTQALTESYRLDEPTGRLVFHSLRDRLDGVRSFLASHEGPELAKVDGPLTITGHAAIEALFREIEVRDVIQYASGVKTITAPRGTLATTGDGSFRIKFDFEDYEAHGIPQSMHYLIHLLQSGLGATTGVSNIQLAHARRGPKRERDLKLLRHVGFAIMLFFETAAFSLELPSTDGDIIDSFEKLKGRLFKRFAQFLVKVDKNDSSNFNEIDETTAPTLEALLSEGIVGLLEATMRQIIDDASADRVTRLFTPEYELRVEGLSHAVIRVFHALVADLARETEGACFTKVRGQWFETFTNLRPGFEREDLTLRKPVSPDVDRQLVYSPGINERFIIPTAKLPPRGAHFLALAHQGFEITLDGRQIERIKEGEFRPEFTLKEEFSNAPLESLALGNRKIDWFELHPRFFFRGKELSPEEAIRLSRDGIIEHDGRFFLLEPQELPNLKRLTRFWETLHGDGDGLLGDKNKRRKTSDTYFQLPRSRALELLALRASGVAIQGGPRWQAICEFYDSLDRERAKLIMPDTFNATLQPYQEVGVQWLLDIRRLGLGGILADDMGLGKTVTSLGFLEVLRAQDDLGPTLVMVPTSLTYNWVSEMARFTPKFRSHLYNSREPEKMLDFVKQKEHGIVICTYGLLQENVALFEQVNWDIVIFDEAQALKTITTKRTTAARKIQSRFKICLTGTPLENHYGEFFSLFDLSVPGSLGDIANFRERYVNPVRVLREDLDELKLRTRPLLLRRTKSQVMHQLPEKTETTMRLPFDEEQKRIYRDIATSYNRQIRDQIAKDGEAKTQLQMLTALLRLRQVCSDPRGIPGVEYASEPPKISTLVEALGEITSEGSSALVFTQFLATFERIREAMTVAGITFFDMSGSDSRAERERKLRGFDEHQGGAVMLMTLKTGGVGLNLVKASYIFHIEPWWNPAVENQATDRAHRIGQTKAVQVYRYIIQDSVEEKIEVLKELKSRRFEALFGPAGEAIETTADIGQGSSRLSQKDFEFLLS